MKNWTPAFVGVSGVRGFLARALFSFLDSGFSSAAFLPPLKREGLRPESAERFRRPKGRVHSTDAIRANPPFHARTLSRSAQACVKALPFQGRKASGKPPAHPGARARMRAEYNLTASRSDRNPDRTRQRANKKIHAPGLKNWIPAFAGVSGLWGFRRSERLRGRRASPPYLLAR